MTGCLLYVNPEPDLGLGQGIMAGIGVVQEVQYPLGVFRAAALPDFFSPLIVFFSHLPENLIFDFLVSKPRADMGFAPGLEDPVNLVECP